MHDHTNGDDEYEHELKPSHSPRVLLSDGTELTVETRSTSTAAPPFGERQPCRSAMGSPGAGVILGSGQGRLPWRDPGGAFNRSRLDSCSSSRPAVR